WLKSFHNAAERARNEQGDFLSYRDSQGRYADFHALRHSFITMVGKAGVSPREHQDLARHSTYALTSRYTHSRFHDLATAVRALPIPVAALETEARAATRTGRKTGAKNLGPNLGPRRPTSVDFGRQRETETAPSRATKKPANTRFPAFSRVMTVAC